MKKKENQDKPLKEQIRIAEMQYMVTELFRKIDSAIKGLKESNIQPLNQIKADLITHIKNNQLASQTSSIHLVEGFPQFLPLFKTQLKEIRDDFNFQKLNDEGYFFDLKESIISVVGKAKIKFENSEFKPKGRKKGRRDFLELIINKNGYSEKYQKDLREKFIDEFYIYDGASLAKLVKSLEDIKFFRPGATTNKTEIYEAFRNEFKNDSMNNLKGFSEAMRDPQNDKAILQKLKEIGFDKLDNLG